MKRKLLSLFMILCMILSINMTMEPAAFAVGPPAPTSNSYFLITKSSPSDSSTETNYYYVYAGTSETALSSFHGTNADSESSTAYSIVDRAITDINASAASTATLHFAATGNTIENANGTLDTGSNRITLTSGTYKIKGAVKTTQDILGNGLFYLQGASVIIDGATIDSPDRGIRNNGIGNVTVNSGIITALSTAIYSEGNGSVTVNGGTITSSKSRAIDFSDLSSGNLTVNGGAISAEDNESGSAIIFKGLGNMSITGGKIHSVADYAISYEGSGSLSISGDLWDDNNQTGTLISTDANRGDIGALFTAPGLTNAKIEGGTLSASRSAALLISSNIVISGGLITTTSNKYPAAINQNGTITITGGTISNSNPNLTLPTDMSVIPGTVANNGNLYISGGTITNSASAGYAVYNCSLMPGQNNYVYLSGTPSITANTATVCSYNNIYANDGNSTYYTGAPVSISYSSAITPGTTVAVSNVSAATNASLFSLINEGYSLQLSGTDLIIRQASSSSLSSILSQRITAGSEAGTAGDPKTASISVANSVSALSSTDITPAVGAIVTFYGTDSTFTTAETGSVALTAGDKTTVYIKVTAQDGQTVGYYAVGITRAAAISSDSSLSTVLSKEISTEGMGGTAAVPINTSISVANSVSAVAATDITSATDSTVIFYGTDSTFTTAETGSVALTAGDKTTVYIKVTAQDGKTVGYYAVTISRAAATSSSSGSSSSSSQSSSSSGTDVLVNGVAQSAGDKITETVDGKTKFTINVNEDVLSQKIAETIANKGTDGTKQNTVEVVVSDTDWDEATVQLNGAIINEMEDNSFDLKVTKGDVSYSIPAKEFTIDAIAEQMGVSKDDLADIEVEVSIGEPSNKALAAYEAAAEAAGNQLIIPPVSFTITAHTTNSDGIERSIEIETFSSYVGRTVHIPDGVDPSKITTGIVFNPDGTYSHVPTEVFQKDGKWYAKLNSLTNSNYSVIWNPIIVKSVENHWSKDAVNDMASRLVIFNPESFEPNKAITRADFAEYIVRALGLYREGSTHENNFKDVSATGVRTLAILIANEYGIVSGYEDGTFRGDNQITREEAMTMYQRAMKITKLTGSNANRISTYSDSAQASKWAVPYVTDVLSANVFNGTTEITISPKANLTYAESAQAIKNLLVESKLINK